VEKASVVERTGQYFREVRAESRKIVWPDLRRTGIYTAVVLVTVGVLALLIYLADLVFGALLSHV
jgi:preprotein translocase subunit SecE